MNRIVIALTILLVLGACQRNSGSEVAYTPIEHKDIIVNGCPKTNGEPQEVQISALTDNASRYHGTLITVSGYYYSNFEHSAIYASATKPYDHDFGNGIWLLNIDPKLGGKHVWVTGVFSSKIRGHLGQWPGSICVTSIKVI